MQWALATQLVTAANNQPKYINFFFGYKRAKKARNIDDRRRKLLTKVANVARRRWWMWLVAARRVGIRKSTKSFKVNIERWNILGSSRNYREN